ncbi:alpha/beta hydrolase [Phanerochaete sordida]|uniref:triacylglycerol lipase n=1 Tax=Phanerochaete sordida TaxID=48140 RepID=A0A9P3GGN5_9APHY|nr:alpha/beta hydrolase [Phanerochaete sordida]
MLPSSLLYILSSALSWLNPDAWARAEANAEQNELLFELRHVHAVSPDARVVWADVSRANALAGDSHGYSASTRIVKTTRPSSHDAFRRARALSRFSKQSAPLDWDEDEIEGPDVESRKTLLHLAKMTNNAYLEPGEAGWYDLGGDWNVSYPFGWEPDQDGFRGHVFATADNSTVVLSIKGTSAGIVGGGGPTSKKDKFNDNLLFSCCCARIDWTWTTVCNCYRGGWKCDQDCLETALVDESLFYSVGTNLYYNLTYMYPESNIWIIGHSLGGALAGLLGATFGVPVVSFEAPGEKMAAGRLHLPSPPSTQHITHVFHTADPIAMGTCNGVFSSCAIAGFAMESRCHLGEVLVYDTVTELQWAVDIRTHGIVNVIENVLNVTWAPAQAVGREVPTPRAETDCVECYSWEFGDFPQTKHAANTSRVYARDGCS